METLYYFFRRRAKKMMVNENKKNILYTHQILGNCLKN